MKLIVGLGNPGEKYENSRHNLGFMVADVLLKHFEPLEKTFWENDKKAKSLFKKIKFEGNDVMLAKSQLFMNNSGFPVASLLNYYNLSPQDLIVVYDDLDLPLGKIRVRFGGAAGGHKGVESIIDYLKTDTFLRVRLGIGKPKKVENSKFKVQSSHIAVEDYVLQNFASNEKSKVRHMTKEAIRILSLILEHGIEKYMSKYNRNHEV